jgi:hypothetical protein
MINSNERFVRWQQILCEQLIFLNNLLLIFSTSIIAFIFSLLKEDHFTPVGCKKLFFFTRLIFTVLSLASGFATAINRLQDF